MRSSHFQCDILDRYLNINKVRSKILLESNYEENIKADCAAEQSQVMLLYMSILQGFWYFAVHMNIFTVLILNFLDIKLAFIGY